MKIPFINYDKLKALINRRFKQGDAANRRLLRILCSATFRCQVYLTGGIRMVRRRSRRWRQVSVVSPNIQNQSSKYTWHTAIYTLSIPVSNWQPLNQLSTIICLFRKEGNMEYWLCLYLFIDYVQRQYAETVELLFPSSGAHRVKCATVNMNWFRYILKLQLVDKFTWSPWGRQCTWGWVSRLYHTDHNWGIWQLDCRTSTWLIWLNKMILNYSIYQSYFINLPDKKKSVR